MTQNNVRCLYKFFKIELFEWLNHRIKNWAEVWKLSNYPMPSSQAIDEYGEDNANKGVMGGNRKRWKRFYSQCHCKC